MEVNYSYTVPESKSLIFQDTKIWITFIFLALALLLGFTLLLKFQHQIIEDQIKFNKTKTTSVVQETKALKEDSEHINYKHNVIQGIYSNNVIIKDSIENLFALIPQKITLTRIKMDKDILHIEGITPSKDMYNYLLAMPLKSIFDKTGVEFFLKDNGWYRFDSRSRFENK